MPSGSPCNVAIVGRLQPLSGGFARHNPCVSQDWCSRAGFGRGGGVAVGQAGSHHRRVPAAAHRTSRGPSRPSASTAATAIPNLGAALLSWMWHGSSRAESGCSLCSRPCIIQCLSAPLQLLTVPAASRSGVYCVAGCQLCVAVRLPDRVPARRMSIVAAILGDLWDPVLHSHISCKETACRACRVALSATSPVVGLAASRVVGFAAAGARSCSRSLWWHLPSAARRLRHSLLGASFRLVHPHVAGAAWCVARCVSLVAGIARCVSPVSPAASPVPPRPLQLGNSSLAPPLQLQPWPASAGGPACDLRWASPAVLLLGLRGRVRASWHCFVAAIVALRAASCSLLPLAS